MEASATTQMQNSAFSGVEEHAKHKFKNKLTDKIINHSNKNINFEDTQFNEEYSKSEDEIAEIKHETFDEELKKYNAAQLKTRNKSRVKTMDQYLANKKWSKRAISTFGDSELQQELLAGKNKQERAELLKKESTGLINYVKRFNQENNNFEVFKAITNVDENKNVIGAPHVHLDIRVMSKTKTGKASMNINNALREEFKHDNPKKEVPTDSRDLMSWFREKNDQLLVEEMSKSLNIEFKLTRKERQKNEMGLSMDEYQQRRQEKRENLRFLKKIDPTAKITWKKEKSGEIEETEPIESLKGEKEAMNAPREAIWTRLKSASSSFREQAKKRIKALRERIREVRERLENRKNEIERRREEINTRKRKTEERRKNVEILKIKDLYKKANTYGEKNSFTDKYKTNADFMKAQPSRTGDPDKSMFDDITKDLEKSEKDPFKYDVKGKDGKIIVFEKESGKSLEELETERIKEIRRKKISDQINLLYQKANEYGRKDNAEYKTNFEFMKNQPSRHDSTKTMFDDVGQDLAKAEKEPFKYDVRGENGQIIVFEKNTGKSLAELEKPKITKEQREEYAMIQSTRRDEVETSNLKESAYKHLDKVDSLAELTSRERMYVKEKYREQLKRDKRKAKRAQINSEKITKQQNQHEERPRPSYKRGGFHM